MRNNSELKAFANRYSEPNEISMAPAHAIEKFFNSVTRYVADSLLSRMQSGYDFMRFEAINNAITSSHSEVSMELGRSWLFNLTESWIDYKTCYMNDACNYLVNYKCAPSERLSYLEYLLIACSQYFQNEWSAIEERICSFLKNSSLKLTYRNLLFRPIDDERVADEIHEPFWIIVEDVIWKNVRLDMEEAFKQRNAGGPNAAFYAARALESTIKIVSDYNGWTKGREKGASNYIDNLVSQSNGRFIDLWEAEMLKRFFSEVRNPDAHGAGSAPQPKLRKEQMIWSIEFCMISIKSLISRL